MIKLLIAVKRNPALSLEQFRQHLSTQHAKLIKACPATAKYMRKYVQSYSLPSGFAGQAQAFDGAAELYFDTVDDMNKFFSDPDYLENVHPDEPRFADVEGSVFIVTEEKQVV